MISGKAVIGNANGVHVFDFCKEKLEHPAKVVGREENVHVSKRSIIYIDAKDIIREETGAHTLPRTRKIHSVKTSDNHLILCHGHSWRVRLAKQETLTPPGHLVSPLVYRGP